MAAGKLIEPKVITDIEQKTVCILPTGFYFDDARWEKIWQRYEEKGEPLGMADLKELFPEERTVQHAAQDTGEKFDRCSGGDDHDDDHDHDHNHDHNRHD